MSEVDGFDVWVYAGSGFSIGESGAQAVARKMIKIKIKFMSPLQPSVP